MVTAWASLPPAPVIASVSADALPSGAVELLGVTASPVAVQTGLWNSPDRSSRLLRWGSIGSPRQTPVMRSCLECPVLVGMNRSGHADERKLGAAGRHRDADARHAAVMASAIGVTEHAVV